MLCVCSWALETLMLVQAPADCMTSSHMLHEETFPCPGFVIKLAQTCPGTVPNGIPDLHLTFQKGTGPWRYGPLGLIVDSCFLFCFLGLCCTKCICHGFMSKTRTFWSFFFFFLSHHSLIKVFDWTVILKSKKINTDHNTVAIPALSYNTVFQWFSCVQTVTHGSESCVCWYQPWQWHSGLPQWLQDVHPLGQRQVSGAVVLGWRGYTVKLWGVIK